MKLKKHSLSVAALLFFINGACVAQSALPQLPDTPAANQAKGWLEVFNAGDVEKRRAFLQKNYPSRLDPPAATRVANFITNRLPIK